MEEPPRCQCVHGIRRKVGSGGPQTLLVERRSAVMARGEIRDFELVGGVDRLVHPAEQRGGIDAVLPREICHCRLIGGGHMRATPAEVRDDRGGHDGVRARGKSHG